MVVLCSSHNLDLPTEPAPHEKLRNFSANKYLTTNMVKVIATKAEFDEVLKSNTKLVAVDFTASWCGPCQRIGPKFVAMAAEYDDVVFIKVDVDENAETAEFCGIEAMPTFQFFKGSVKVDELVGASEQALKDKIESNK
jgi:thioredoxin 1